MAKYFSKDEVSRWLVPNVGCHLPTRSDDSSHSGASTIWCAFLHSSSTSGLYVVVSILIQRTWTKIIRESSQHNRFDRSIFEIETFCTQIATLLCNYIHSFKQSLNSCCNARGTVQALFVSHAVIAQGSWKGREDIYVLWLSWTRSADRVLVSQKVKEHTAKSSCEQFRSYHYGN